MNTVRLIAPAILALVLVACWYGCTQQQAAKAVDAVMPLAATVVCDQVTTDEKGHQVCHLTADAVRALVPVVMAAVSSAAPASSAACPSASSAQPAWEALPDAGDATQGVDAHPGTPPG